MAILFLLCGLPGSGKTTLAKRLAVERKALRLTPDEWMTPLFGIEIHGADGSARFDDLHDRVEKVQWMVAEGALRAGCNVVLDFGVWSRSERDEFRARAAALGASCEIVYLDVALDELMRRIHDRNKRLGSSFYQISEAELEVWWDLFETPTEEELNQGY